MPAFLQCASANRTSSRGGSSSATKPRKSYGAAAREADIKAKKMTPMDAEAIINGTKYSMGNQREEESQSA
jgi:hypothetical protein